MRQQLPHKLLHDVPAHKPSENRHVSSVPVVMAPTHSRALVSSLPSYLCSLTTSRRAAPLQEPQRQSGSCCGSRAWPSPACGHPETPALAVARMSLHTNFIPCLMRRMASQSQLVGFTGEAPCCRDGRPRVAGAPGRGPARNLARLRRADQVARDLVCAQQDLRRRGARALAAARDHKRGRRRT